MGLIECTYSRSVTVLRIFYYFYFLGKGKTKENIPPKKMVKLHNYPLGFGSFTN
jgi:hypothetical protein